MSESLKKLKELSVVNKIIAELERELGLKEKVRIKIAPGCVCLTL